MKEMRARAKTDTTKDGAKTSAPRARAKIDDKHGGYGGKGKNNTLKLR